MSNALAKTDLLRVIYSEAHLLARTILDDRPTRQTILLIFAGILVVISGYSIAMALKSDFWIAERMVSAIGLGRDRSMSEIVNYGLALLGSVLFMFGFFAHRSFVQLFLALLMAFVWFDDSAMYHERFGAHLVSAYDLPTFFGLRQQDSGELLAWALAGVILGLVLLFCWPRRRSGDAGVFALVSLGFCVLVMCGVVADLIHIIVDQRFDALVGVIEDGGEMLAVAFVAGVALGLSQNGDDYYRSASRLGA